MARPPRSGSEIGSLACDHAAVTTIDSKVGPATWLRAPGRVVVVLVASFLLGGLTSHAQGFLPAALSSFANSASGWTLLTALLVYWSRLPARWAAVLGAASFVLLVLGYAAASELRGLHYDPTRWSSIGVVAGVVVGSATAWLRASGVRAACGVAVLAGIAIGDAIHGLTVVQDTTSPIYWLIMGAAGLCLLGVMLARRLRGAAPAVVAVLGTAAVAAALLLGYRALGAV